MLIVFTRTNNDYINDLLRSIFVKLRKRVDKVQLILPSSLERLVIRSCPLTDSTLREGFRGLTSLESLDILNIAFLLPSANVLGCLTMLEKLHIAMLVPNIAGEFARPRLIAQSCHILLPWHICFYPSYLYGRLKLRHVIGKFG
uniref:Uncharacterized protein n=1 Tax=Ananas comosus var. bracteatus TaxID=296719 RepID=A0A6V7PH01_ANACO|nr:unnamed protein product [Ananas comosus var. bracteatus]